MASSDWEISGHDQPKPEDYDFDLDQALTAVVGLKANIPAAAFTADTLGTERAGNGVLIRPDGLVLTMGYLITEAEIDLAASPRWSRGAGACARLRPADRLWAGPGARSVALPALAFGNSAKTRIGDRVVVAGAGGRTARGRRSHRRQAGIRRLLGIRARRSDLHGARTPQLGRNRGHRFRRQARRGRFVAGRAGERGPPSPFQHDRADRSVEAGARRSAQVRPAQSSAAAMARALRHRGGGQDRHRRARRERPGHARRPGDRRPGACGQRRPTLPTSPACIAASGRSARPESRCRSRFFARDTRRNCA